MSPLSLLSASAKTLVPETRFQKKKRKKNLIQPQRMDRQHNLDVRGRLKTPQREICLSGLTFGAKNIFPVGVREIKIINKKLKFVGSRTFGA